MTDSPGVASCVGNPGLWDEVPLGQMASAATKRMWDFAAQVPGRSRFQELLIRASNSAGSPGFGSGESSYHRLFSLRSSL